MTADDEMIIIQQAMFAVAPWKSLDAKYPINFERLIDSQEQINKCLACTKCDCTNCLHGRKTKYVSKKLITLNAACAEA